MIRLCINNEFDKIKQVVLGIADDFGGCPTLDQAYDPKSKENILNGTFPLEKDLKLELKNFVNIFHKHGVDVLRPVNIFDTNQIFSRDVGFVVGDTFFISNMIQKRMDEILGFEFILKKIHSSCIENIPADVSVEGGDVLVCEDHLFIGYSEDLDFHKYEVSRTNKEALDFFKVRFPNKQVVGFQLNKSDDNPHKNCLHLDCCFQPLGLGHVIVCPDGFKRESDLLLIKEIFGESNIILINRDEMYNMFANIFSIGKNIIVSDQKFKRLNNKLKNKGYVVEEISFSEISKMGGLLRCSTLPLVR